jgi:hypothetical protein
MAKRVWRGRIALAKRRLMGGRKRRSDVMVIADNSRKGVWFLGRPWLPRRRLRTGLDPQLATEAEKAELFYELSPESWCQTVFTGTIRSFGRTIPSRYSLSSW